jgi:hypothetical protein
MPMSMQDTKKYIIDGEALGREAAAFNKLKKKAAASRPHSKAPFGANESMQFINRLSIVKSTG